MCVWMMDIWAFFFFLAFCESKLVATYVLFKYLVTPKLELHYETETIRHPNKILCVVIVQHAFNILSRHYLPAWENLHVFWKST